MRVDWQIKTQAFLYGLTRGALALNADRDAWADKFINAAFEGAARGIAPAARTADAIAAVSDIPPFIEALALPNFRDKPVLTHPLSGDKRDFPDFSQVSPDAFLDVLVAGTRDIVSAETNDQNRFLALWRHLPDAVRARNKNALGHLADLLPADPRIPSHSIWQHAALAAAIAGATDSSTAKPAFLTFTIASPQSFIASARRTQDYWMGSFLIAYLIWAAIKIIAQHCGPDTLIYPSLHAQPLADHWLLKEMKINGLNLADSEQLQIANLPNRFTAIVPWAEAASLAKDAEEAVGGAFKRIAGLENGKCIGGVLSALEKVRPDLATDKSWRAIWRRQVDGLADGLGVFWSVLSWDRLPDCTDAVQKVDQAFAEGKDWLGKDFRDEEQLWTHTKSTTPDRTNLGMAYKPLSALSARLLDNRKFLRNFCNVEGGEPGEKCTQCGVREALHPEHGGAYPQLRAFWDDLRSIDEGNGIDKVKLAGRIRRGDRLCAVCLVRRLAWEHSFLKDIFRDVVHQKQHLLFPSTSSIATAPFKLNLLQKACSNAEIKDRIIDYTDCVGRMLKVNRIFFWSTAMPRLATEIGDLNPEFLRIDGDWLFEESFDAKAIRREYSLPREVTIENLDKARGALTALLKEAEKHNLGKPSRYYALVAMDGDKMGKWISGQNNKILKEYLHEQCVINEDVNTLVNARRPLGPALHLALSDTMKEFALSVVRPLVEQAHCGKLVYAGGDDVSALVPVADLTGTLRDLHRTFSGVFKDDRPIEGLELLGAGFAKKNSRGFSLAGAKFTASAGVAIVHHSHPFSHAVEAAEKAMKEDAKERIGGEQRNAFAIHLFTRGGAPLKAGARWEETGSNGSVHALDVIKKAADLFARGILSSRLPYVWGRLAPNIEETDAQQAMLQHLFNRHVDAKQLRNETAETFGQLQTQLNALIEIWDREYAERKQEFKREGQTVTPLDPPGERARDFLLLARFLASEGAK